jgi:hypothetical protein
MACLKALFSLPLERITETTKTTEGAGKPADIRNGHLLGISFEQSTTSVPLVQSRNHGVLEQDHSFRITAGIL